jgi:hypothetical protein
MYDYRFCFAGDDARPLTPDHTTALHARAAGFLERALDDDPNAPTVVLTHHAPTFDGVSVARHSGDPLQCCYASDLTRLLDRARFPGLAAWAHGHTHMFNDRVVAGGVRVLSNPQGYPAEREHCGGLARRVIIDLSAGKSTSPASMEEPTSARPRLE